VNLGCAIEDAWAFALVWLEPGEVENAGLQLRAPVLTQRTLLLLNSSEFALGHDGTSWPQIIAEFSISLHARHGLASHILLPLSLLTSLEIEQLCRLADECRLVC